jgi:hypothetical protein
MPHLPRSSAGVGADELAAALDKGLSLGSSLGGGLERQASADMNNPFSVAAKMVAGLRQTPSGEQVLPAGPYVSGLPFGLFVFLLHSLVGPKLRRVQGHGVGVMP